MAKATVEIICSECGNRFKHSKVFGSRADADRYENWALEHIKVCPECANKHRIESEQAKAEQEKSEYGLVKLNGTEKQVAWADRIRAKFFEALRKMIKPTAIEKVVSVINHYDSAAWWIEKRIDTEVNVKAFYLEMKKSINN